MKTYSFVHGRLTDGLPLTADERLGQIVFLGEEGRGRRYEKVALDRRFPPVVTDNRVLDCELRKVTLPPKDGKPEKVFYVLERSRGNSDAILVRINTEGTYTKNTSGGWRTVAGKPEDVTSGYGAYGLAGRIGNWDDGLVIMRPGDVLCVKRSGGHKNRPDALYFNEEKGVLEVADFEEWQALTAMNHVQETSVETEVLYGVMPVFVFSPAGLKKGIETVAIGIGRGFQLGPRKGAWRIDKKVTVAVANDLPIYVTEAAVAKSGENFILVNSMKVESGKYLVRIDTDGLRKRGRTGAIAVRGAPTLLTEGWMEIGTENVEHHRDQLWVLAEGDVLRVGQTYEEFYSSDDAILIKDGEVVTEQFRDWALREARRDPAPFIADGWCPIDCLPAEWVGKVVEACDAKRESSRSPYLLKAVRPEPVFMGGWDSLKPEDRFSVAVTSDVVWVKLRPELNAEAQTNILEVKEVVEFGDPPLPSGKRVFATISIEHAHHEASWGHSASDETVYVIQVADVPASKYRVTRYQKSGQNREDKEPLGQVQETWTLRTPAGIYCRLRLPEGLTEPNGEYAVEFVDPRRGGWYVEVFLQEALDREKEQILAEVKAGLQLRRWARPIPGKAGLYGMPVSEDGWTPCEPEKASKWVMYEEDHRWPNSYPEAYVLVSMKGYRSKSSGATFAALVADYTRP